MSWKNLLSRKFIVTMVALGMITLFVVISKVTWSEIYPFLILIVGGYFNANSKDKQDGNREN